MEISWIVNIFNTWSLVFLVSIYGVWYYFIEIVLWEDYLCSKQLNTWNHISIKALHYLFWGLPITFSFFFLIIIAWDLWALNNLLNAISEFINVFSPHEEWDIWLFWLVVSIIYFYTLVGISFICKYAIKFVIYFSKILVSNNSADLYKKGFWILILWIIWFSAIRLLEFQDFLEHQIISHYIETVNNFLYYGAIIIPILLSYIIFKYKWSKQNQVLSFFGSSFIFASIYFLLLAIFGIKLTSIQNLIYHIFAGDIVWGVSNIVYHTVLFIFAIVVFLWWYFLLKKASYKDREDARVNGIIEAYLDMNEKE